MVHKGFGKGRQKAKAPANKATERTVPYFLDLLQKFFVI